MRVIPERSSHRRLNPFKRFFRTRGVHGPGALLPSFFPEEVRKRAGGTPPWLCGEGFSSVGVSSSSQCLALTEQNRTEQNRTEGNRTEQKGTEQKGTEQNRTEQKGTEQNRTEQNRTEQNRTELQKGLGCSMSNSGLSHGPSDGCSARYSPGRPR